MKSRPITATPTVLIPTIVYLPILFEYNNFNLINYESMSRKNNLSNRKWKVYIKADGRFSNALLAF